MLVMTQQQWSTENIPELGGLLSAAQLERTSGEDPLLVLLPLGENTGKYKPELKIFRALALLAKEHDLYLAGAAPVIPKGLKAAQTIGFLFGPDGKALLRVPKVTPDYLTGFSDTTCELGKRAKFPTAKTPLGVVGILVGEDIFQTHLGRALTWHGAEIILNPALPEPITGCTDNIACNYDENADEEDGSCDYSCYDWGCLDSNYDNYDSEANMDQGSCLNFTDTTIEDIVTDFSIGACNTIGDEVKVWGKIIEYTQITPTFWILSIIDDNGFIIEVLPGEGSESWQINESYLDYLVDPYSYTEYTVSVHGIVGEYPDTNGECEGKPQIITIGKESSIDDFIRYHTDGEHFKTDCSIFNFLTCEESIFCTWDGDKSTGECIDKTTVPANIVVAPYVVIPSIGERINFMYSFAAGSRVIVRIYSLDGRFITSLVDKYYEKSGSVVRAEDLSDWDGRDHFGQIVQPGTYLIHIEATNFLTGHTSVDTAPIVVGVPY